MIISFTIEAKQASLGEVHETPAVQEYVVGQLSLVDGEISGGTTVVAQSHEPCPPVTTVARRHVTYSTYSKREPSERWSLEDTQLFYEALSQCGTDFSMMHRLFPKRTRKQLKNKFKYEQHRNKALVDEALSRRLPLDISQYIPQPIEDLDLLAVDFPPVSSVVIDS
ncbi:hypothetical protein Zmor_004273 [Zophobas morio]|uniref:Myb-like domain-containing protein n=1 Tax=Zophobas morio TaxID=2755281 RepID=A0AA38HIG6_9CUCU|nr:hypothetical protein Zmor_004273 [Zophobas morio]